MAVLAPVRYPVVVGVIALGLVNPDPAYAPTFQTTPEDRPSLLEAAGETGLAVAIGAAGIKLGQAGSAAHGNSLLSTRSQHVYEILTSGFDDTVPEWLFHPPCESNCTRTSGGLGQALAPAAAALGAAAAPSRG